MSGPSLVGRHLQQCSRSPCSIFPDIAAPAISEFDASEISELALEVGGLVAPTLESLPAPADPGCHSDAVSAGIGL